MVTLDIESLKSQAPAIFAEEPSNSVSDRYSFLPTTRVLEILDDAGWKPWKAEQVRGRTLDRQRTAKHLIRLRHEDLALDHDSEVGDVFPEMLLINSHDGLSTYQLRAGIFRLICSNGMVVSDEDFGEMRIRHQAFDPKEVYEASEIFCENTTKLNSTINAWRDVNLTPVRQKMFAIEASKLRFNNPDSFTTDNVLMARRAEDQGNSLWLTFNRCQENLMTGGWLNQDTRRRVRPVKSIQKNVKLNSDLWDLGKSYELQASEN